MRTGRFHTSLALSRADRKGVVVDVVNQFGKVEVTVKGDRIESDADLEPMEAEKLQRLFALPMEQIRFGNIGQAAIMIDDVINGGRVQPAFLEVDDIVETLESRVAKEDFCKLPRSDQQRVIERISHQIEDERRMAFQENDHAGVGIHSIRCMRLRDWRTYFLELQHINSEAGAAIENKFGTKPGTLLRKYQEGDKIEARKKLCEIAGIDSNDHSNDRLFFAIITGDLINQLAGKTDMVRAEDGLVGAQAFRLEDGSHDYVKLIDMRPAQAGTMNLRKAGIPTEEIRTLRKDGGPLLFLNPDGGVSYYGISKDIRKFRGAIHRSGIRLELETLEAYELSRMYKSPAMMKFYHYMPEEFFAEFGYCLAAQIANSSSDGHSGNSWGMLLRVNNSQQEIDELRQKGYFIENDNGVHKMFMVGRIDCDDSSGAYLAKGSGLQMDATDLEERIGGVGVLQRVFANFTLLKNRIIHAMAMREAKEPKYVNVSSVVETAFSGPVQEGMRRWHDDHHNAKYFQWMMEHMEKRREMPIGFAIPLDAAQREKLHSEGVIYFGWSCNGEERFPVFTYDGRSKMFDDHELVLADFMSDEVSDLFPNGRSVYAIPETKFRPVYESSGKRFSVIGSEVHDGIRVTRTGDVIRAGQGFARLCGIPTESFGAKFAYTTIMTSGLDGLLARAMRIRDIILKSEINMENYAQYRRHSVLQRFLIERLPEGELYPFREDV